MSEGQLPPVHPTYIEALPPNNRFYQAIMDNQSTFREIRPTIAGQYEMPRVSEKIEQNMKRVFTEYIDPAYPRVIVARTLLLNNSFPSEIPLYAYGGGYRYPESVRSEEQQPYAKGINALNEWATNYATRYYLEHASNTPFTKPIRQAYAQVGDALTYGMIYPRAYKAMAEVKKTARATSVHFDHAVFQALFQHEFTPLNTLIAQTEIPQAANLDELAILLGKQAGKAAETPTTPFTHIIEKTQDATFVKSLKTTGYSAILGGQFQAPGVVEVGIGGTIAAAALGALSTTIETAVVYGDMRSAMLVGAAAGGIALGNMSTFLVFTAIHESVHGYSAADNYLGFMPQQLYLYRPSIVPGDQ